MSLDVSPGGESRCLLDDIGSLEGQLLEERMPGGPVGGKHPESSEEYESRGQGGPRGADEPTSGPTGFRQSTLKAAAGKSQPKEDSRKGEV